MLSFDELNHYLSYDPDTGLLHWKFRRPGVKAWSEAGRFHKRSGHIIVWVNGKTMPAHRIGWLLHYGSIDEREIEHINTIKTDNRVANLRQSIMTPKERHALRSTPTHNLWGQMRNRCMNPKNKDFKYYGAIGVTVCERWSRFENFLADMGEKPEGLTLDRFPDQKGPYSPENCRWTTMKEQNRNRRSQIMLTYNDRTQCLTAWAEELEVPVAGLRSLIRKEKLDPDILLAQVISDLLRNRHTCGLRRFDATKYQTHEKKAA